MTDTILVTGATGFLGRHLVQHLRSAGMPVIAMGRDPAECQRLADEGVTIWRADLSAATDLQWIGDGTPIHAVVHCAGLSANWGKKRDFQRFNVTATANVLNFAKRLGARKFIYVSSSSVYFQFCDQIGVREDHPLPPPINAYAWSKAEAETVVAACKDLETIIIRPRGIYGKGDRALLPRLIRAAQRGPLPLMRGGRAVIDLTHVGDVSGSIAALLSKTHGTSGTIYNVSGGESLLVREIVAKSAARAGIPVTWRTTPWPLARGLARATEAFHMAIRPDIEPAITAYSAGLFAFSQTLNIGRIYQETRWRPAISFEEGLRQTFAG